MVGFRRSSTFNRDINTLPSSGIASNIPWPGDYWPAWRDGINYVWRASDPSASLKYSVSQTNGIFSPPDSYSLENQVSRYFGIDLWRRNAQCVADSNCMSGSKCGIRRGQSVGSCIPVWFGICHAWAPASIMEPGPRCSVTYNNVLFNIMDLKALITQLYAQSGIPTAFAGTRCNIDSPRDQYGRFIDPRCRDVTPDFFHIAISNLIGIQRRSFRMISFELI